ncbi:hypothetical protein DFAR_1920001 [Desulfarculales bacterium]
MRGLALNALNRFQRGPTAHSLIYQLLKPIRPEYLLLIMGKAILPAAKRAVSHYLTSLVKVRSSLGGADLMAMGFAPGPVYRHILDRLTAARLDQEIMSREEEAALVEREFGPRS